MSNGCLNVSSGSRSIHVPGVQHLCSVVPSFSFCCTQVVTKILMVFVSVIRATPFSIILNIRLGLCLIRKLIGYSYRPCERSCWLHGDPTGMGLTDGDTWSNSTGEKNGKTYRQMWQQLPVERVPRIIYMYRRVDMIATRLRIPTT